MNTYKLTRPQIAIDGVFFQLSNGGISRVWTSLLREWVKSGFSQHLVLLDRGGTAPQIPGINYYPIDRYEWDRTALDSFRLQEICDRDVALFYVYLLHPAELNNSNFLESDRSVGRDV